MWFREFLPRILNSGKNWFCKLTVICRLSIFVVSQHFTTRKRKRLLVTLLFEIILQGQQCVDSISMIGRKY